MSALPEIALQCPQLGSFPQPHVWVLSIATSLRLVVNIDASIITSLGGLEPPSSRLTAERASLLRHRDLLQKLFLVFFRAWFGTAESEKCFRFLFKNSRAWMHELATLVGLEPTAFEYLYWDA